MDNNKIKQTSNNTSTTSNIKQIPTTKTTTSVSQQPPKIAQSVNQAKSTSTDKQVSVQPQNSNTKQIAQPTLNNDKTFVNPQTAINEVASTTSNVGYNNAKIIISETTEVQAAKNTVIIATKSNGLVSPTNAPMPNQININEQKTEVKTKKGKKIKIVTKREKITNALVTIFFLCITAGIGYGVYYYILNENPANFVAKNVTLEYKEPIPQTSSYYINLKNISDLDYAINLSNVKEEIGSYSYTVQYKNVIKTGTITIQDTKGPVITPKENIVIPINSPITKEQLVEKCEDPSNCTSYEIASDINNLSEGTHTITIQATDDLNNTSTVDIPILVTSVAPKTLKCVKERIPSTDNKYTYKEENIITFNNDIISTYQKTITGTFPVFKDYLDFQDTISDFSLYKFDSVSQTFTVTTNELNVNNENEYDKVESYFNNNSYTCE